MRHFIMSMAVAGAFAAVVPTVAIAQSAVVDLSKPQTGKARFVLNSDLTPADMGVIQKGPENPGSNERVPACGVGCKLDPTPASASRQASEPAPASAQSRNRSRVFVVAGFGGQGAAKTAQPAVARKKSGFTFRFRRR
jgi:hypothetical protein